MWTSEFVSVECGLYWTVVCAGKNEGCCDFVVYLTDVLKCYQRPSNLSEIGWLLECWVKELYILK